MMDDIHMRRALMDHDGVHPVMPGRMKEYSVMLVHVVRNGVMAVMNTRMDRGQCRDCGDGGRDRDGGKSKGLLKAHKENSLEQRREIATATVIEDTGSNRSVASNRPDRGPAETLIGRGRGSQSEDPIPVRPPETESNLGLGSTLLQEIGPAVG
jgi:hypothetical protein